MCLLPSNALWLTSAGVIPITESVEENHFRRQDSTLNVEKTKGLATIDVESAPRFAPQLYPLTHGSTFSVRLLREPRYPKLVIAVSPPVDTSSEDTLAWEGRLQGCGWRPWFAHGFPRRRRGEASGHGRSSAVSRSSASSGAEGRGVCRERGRRVSTPRRSAGATRGWAAPAHVHWRSWASACPMASSSCSSSSSRTTVRLADCPSAIYWSAILQRSRSSITGSWPYGSPSCRRAGAMARPGVQDTGWTADGRREATTAEGAPRARLGRGRVGVVGQVLQRGTQMEHGFAYRICEIRDSVTSRTWPISRIVSSSK